MGLSIGGGAGVGVGGSGLQLRTPPDVFVGATRAAAVAARNAGLNAGDIAEFDASPNLLLILRIAGADTYQARRGGGWVDVTNVAPGQPGPPGPQRSAQSIKDALDGLADTHLLSDSDLALLRSVADPRRLLAALQWDVTPSVLDGRTAADFERTFRLELEVPYLPLTDYYVEVRVHGFVTHARTRWAQVTHLDTAVSSVNAGDIAANLAADQDHVEVEIALYKDAIAVAPAAVASRRVLIVEAAAGDGGGQDTGTDSTARAAAAAAARSAASNKAAIEAAGRVAIGRVDVNPGRIAAAADLDGAYQCIVTLTDAERTRLAAAGVNYLEMWFGSEAVHVVSPWAPALATRVDVVVDTTEESAIGAPGTALAVRAVYRINQVGSQTYYSEGAGALRIGGVSEGAGAAPSLAQQIPLLNLIPEPAGIVFRSYDGLVAAVKRIRIGVPNPEALTGDVWVAGATQGQPSLARTKWATNNAVLVLDLSDALAEGVATATIADSEIEVRLRFYDAAVDGNEVERIGVNIPLIDQRPRTQTLVSAAAIEWDVDDGALASLTAEHSFTLTLSGGEDGAFAVLRVAQDGTGTRVMTLNNAIARDGRDAPVLSTDANAHDNVLFMRRGAVWVYLGAILHG